MSNSRNSFDPEMFGHHVVGLIQSCIAFIPSRGPVIGMSERRIVIKSQWWPSLCDGLSLSLSQRNHNNDETAAMWNHQSCGWNSEIQLCRSVIPARSTRRRKGKHTSSWSWWSRDMMSLYSSGLLFALMINWSFMLWTLRYQVLWCSRFRWRWSSSMEAAMKIEFWCHSDRIQRGKRGLERVDMRDIKMTMRSSDHDDGTFFSHIQYSAEHEFMNGFYTTRWVSVQYHPPPPHDGDSLWHQLVWSHYIIVISEIMIVWKKNRLWRGDRQRRGDRTGYIRLWAFKQKWHQVDYFTSKSVWILVPQDWLTVKRNDPGVRLGQKKSFHKEWQTW